MLVTLDESNNKTSENIVSTGGDIIAGKRFEGLYTDKWYFYNYDKRGSVTSILAPDGAYTSGYQYDAFGNSSKSGDSSFKNEMEFIGSISDTSSGLYYMNARYYNPKTGRFLIQDAMGGDAWTNNLYSYCGNNPVNFIDPTGYRLVVDEDEHGRPITTAQSANPYIPGSGSSSNNGWRKYADLAAAFFKLANKCDDDLRKMTDGITPGGRFYPTREWSQKFTTLYNLKEKCNGLYWDNKEKAANASDINDLRDSTEGIINDTLENNAQIAGTFNGDLIKFYNMVKSGAPWDYKHSDIRSAPDSSTNQIASLEYVYANGQVMTWEEFGNFNFGYTGKAAGIADTLLIWGSEHAAGWKIDNNELIDQKWINMGIIAYSNNH